MKKMIFKFLTIALVFVLTGCASYYRPINPPTVSYDSRETNEGVVFSYKYDVLRESGNKKFADKEIKKGVKLIAVKITNNTGSMLNIGRDIAFYSGNKQLTPMNPIVIKESIKQITPGYLTYLLLTLVNVYVTNGSSTQTYQVGLILGPAVTIGNMAVAGAANKNLLKELDLYNIQDKDVEVGETVYGIVGFRDLGYSPLTLKVVR